MDIEQAHCQTSDFTYISTINKHIQFSFNQATYLDLIQVRLGPQGRNQNVLGLLQHVLE